MRTYQGGALISEKEHNTRKYRIMLSEYNDSQDDRFCNLEVEIAVEMKVLCFWITIWKEYVYGSDCKNVDKYNDEIEYVTIKAEDILDALTF